MISSSKKINFELLKIEVLSRENLSNTSLEDGIAIPHARIDIIDKPVVAFAFFKGRYILEFSRR
ncbi:PTS sugar transporter subunit IIA [uncultured Ilyobacter sp.]|uniref:PTS sugar transporter subunit IIA n=1 Tax=uncultured Ilyobacter sp. TaxID=544433 RepID=UPI0037492497